MDRWERGMERHVKRRKKKIERNMITRENESKGEQRRKARQGEGNQE